MKIEAYYIDGRFEVYDTEAHFNGTNALGGGANCMTTYSVKGLNDDGLWISYSFYDVSESLSVAGHAAQCATLQRVIDVQVLDEDDFKGVAWISIDGVKRYFRLREGEKLINGFKFETANDIHVGTKEVAAIEDKAFDLYMVLHGEGTCPGTMRREPGESEYDFNARIAEVIGWPADVLMRAVDEVRARADYVASEGVKDTAGDESSFPASSEDGEIIGGAIMFGDEPEPMPAGDDSGAAAVPAAPVWASSAATPDVQAGLGEAMPEFADPVPAYAMVAEEDDGMPAFDDE